MNEEKPFEPSKKKLDRARREGKTARSSLFVQLFSVVIGLYVFPLILSFSWVELKMLLEYVLTQGFLEPERVGVLVMSKLLQLLGLCLIFGALSSILLEILQVGLRFEPAVLLPKASMLDLGGGFKRIFSGFKSCWVFALRLVVWALALYACLSSAFSELGFTAAAEPQFLTAALSRAWSDLAFGCFIVAGILGGADLLVQRLKFQRELGMTHEELRKELKEDEGDPHVKGNRQAMQRALTYGEVLQRVKQAKVIVVERRA